MARTIQTIVIDTITHKCTHQHFVQTSREKPHMHAGDLLHALETVTARTLHCSTVRCFLVTGSFIGMERDGLVMLTDTLPAPRHEPIRVSVTSRLTEGRIQL
jgi:hypothetical protein